MKKLSKKTIILIITVVLITIATILYFAAPPYLYNKAIEGQRVAANLTIKSVNIPGVSIVYAEGGTGDTIIMLHGLGANKNFLVKFCEIPYAQLSGNHS
jgi:hypothetical protein